MYGKVFGRVSFSKVYLYLVNAGNGRGTGKADRQRQGKPVVLTYQHVYFSTILIYQLS